MMITTHEQLTIHCKLNWNSLEAFVTSKRAFIKICVVLGLLNSQVTELSRIR